jgi:hypothetical protein
VIAATLDEAENLIAFWGTSRALCGLLFESTANK